jgi:hypothetical protein
MAGRQRSRTPRGVVSRGDETTDVVVAAEMFATFLHKQFLCNKAPAMTVQQTAALATAAGAGGVPFPAAAGASGKAQKILARDPYEDNFEACDYTRALLCQHSHHSTQIKGGGLGKTSCVVAI